MPILSFKKRFANLVRRGLKRQTIRAFRKYPIKKGDRLYLYTALRTKYATKLREATCKDTEIVQIRKSGVRLVHPGAPREFNVKMYPGPLLDRFAQRDGFKDWDDMRAFWHENNSLPFEGTIIYW